MLGVATDLETLRLRDERGGWKRSTRGLLRRRRWRFLRSLTKT
jgi:hypothetical protein